MRVLEVGCGAGDVALLAADLVGPQGKVVGVDTNPKILDTSRDRVAAAGGRTFRSNTASLTASNRATISPPSSDGGS
jgi:ubiquinone/menaquinone biosynthesis C-methylase UbiE